MISRIYHIILFLIVLIKNTDFTQGVELQECVMQHEATFCYYCDSKYDSSCGDPFKYSHYYLLNEIYLTECMGCCTKIVHPQEPDGSRRIVRSCTESLPRALNFSLEENCQSWEPTDHRVCLCTSELCNSSNRLTLPSALNVVGFCIVFIRMFISSL